MPPKRSSSRSHVAAAAASSSTAAAPGPVSNVEKWAADSFKNAAAELLRTSLVLRVDSTASKKDASELTSVLPVGRFALDSRGSAGKDGSNENNNNDDDDDDNDDNDDGRVKSYALAYSTSDRRLRLVSVDDLSVERVWTLPAGFAKDQFAIVESPQRGQQRPRRPQQRRRSAAGGEQSSLSCVGVQHQRKLWQWQLAADTVATDTMTSSAQCRCATLPDSAVALHWFSTSGEHALQSSSSSSSLSISSAPHSDDDSSSDDSNNTDDDAPTGKEGVLIVVTAGGSIVVYNSDLQQLLCYDELFAGERTAKPSKTDVLASRFYRLPGARARLVLLVSAVEAAVAKPATPRRRGKTEPAAAPSTRHYFVCLDVDYAAPRRQRTAGTVTIQAVAQLLVASLHSSDGTSSGVSELLDWQISGQGSQLSIVWADKTWLQYDMDNARPVFRHSLAFLDGRQINVVPLSGAVASPVHSLALVGFESSAAEADAAAEVSLTLWNTRYGTCTSQYHVHLSAKHRLRAFSAVELGSERIGLRFADRLLSVELPAKVYPASTLIGTLGSAASTRHLLGANSQSPPSAPLAFPLASMLLDRERHRIHIPAHVKQQSGPLPFYVAAATRDALAQQQQAYRRVATATSAAALRSALVDYLLNYTALTKDQQLAVQQACSDAGLTPVSSSSSSSSAVAPMPIGLVDLVLKACSHRLQQHASAVDDGDDTDIWWHIVKLVLIVARPSARSHPQLMSLMLHNERYSLMQDVLRRHLVQDISEEQLCQLLVALLSPMDSSKQLALVRSVATDDDDDDDDDVGDSVDGDDSDRQARRAFQRAQQVLVSLILMQPFSSVILTQTIVGALTSELAFQLLLVLHRLIALHTKLRNPQQTSAPTLRCVLTWSGLLLDAFATQFIAADAYSDHLRRFRAIIAHFENELQSMHELRAILDVFVHQQPLPKEVPTYQIELIYV